MHSTSGSFSRSLGGRWDEVSTGMHLGSFWSKGVSEPGVDGGVKAGLSNVPGGGEPGLLSLRS